MYGWWQKNAKILCLWNEYNVLVLPEQYRHAKAGTLQDP